MAHTINDFLEYYPEFSDITDQTIINRYLEEVDSIVTLTRCPEIATLMRYAYAAHSLAKSSSAPGGMNDGIGHVTSVSVGSVSETREIGPKKTRSYSDDWYGSTHYGLRFLQLRNRCFSSVMVVP